MGTIVTEGKRACSDLIPGGSPLSRSSVLVETRRALDFPDLSPGVISARLGWLMFGSALGPTREEHGSPMRTPSFLIARVNPSSMSSCQLKFLT